MDGEFDRKNYDSKREIIEYPYVDVWDPNLLKPALNDFNEREKRR